MGQDSYGASERPDRRFIGASLRADELIPHYRFIILSRPSVLRWKLVWEPQGVTLSSQKMKLAEMDEDADLLRNPDQFSAIEQLRVESLTK